MKLCLIIHSCGDEIELQLFIDDGVISKVSVDGRGCAISRHQVHC